MSKSELEGVVLRLCHSFEEDMSLPEIREALASMLGYYRTRITGQDGAAAPGSPLVSLALDARGIETLSHVLARVASEEAREARGWAPGTIREERHLDIGRRVEAVRRLLDDACGVAPA